MTTTYLQSERTEPWFRDVDGAVRSSKYLDETNTYVFDLTGQLASAETISSVSWTLTGFDTSSTSNTTATITATVSGVGKIEAVVTTSTGRTIRIERELVAVEGKRSDYA